jgi:hypothetical protein
MMATGIEYSLMASAAYNSNDEPNQQDSISRGVGVARIDRVRPQDKYHGL